MKIPAVEPEGGDTIMAQILVEENESLERAIRRFKRMVEREGIIRECKRREHYEKPSTIRNRKNKAMQRKLIKKVVGRRHALRERDRVLKERPGSYPPPR
jgi:small subunit ribosomal protein S21